jgi:hypothetical protein
VKTRKLLIPCPTCRSEETYYTCTPGCCFNHVCGNCGTTFEPVTKPAGGKLKDVLPPDPLPESGDPTAECARCQSISVFMTEEGSPVCGKCGTLLELELTEIAPG